MYPLLSRIAKFICLCTLCYSDAAARVHSAFDYYSTPQDTQDLNALEQEVQSLIHSFDNRLDSQKENLAAAKSELNKAAMSKAKPKALHAKVIQLEQTYKKEIRIRNYLLSVLEKIRKLPYQAEGNQNAFISELKRNLSAIKNNQVQKVADIQNASAEMYVADENSDIYSENLLTPCNLSTNMQSGLTANAFVKLFDLTEDRLSAYFREDEFLSCYSRFIRSKSDYFLELKFVINSPKASHIFGVVDPQNPSRLDFMNGEFAYLNVFAVSEPTIDAIKGQTIYHIQYILDKEDIGRIRKNSLDFITLLWSTGAERYEIYNIELLKNQFACIRNMN